MAHDPVPRGAHEWISFPDPKEERTWVFDVTFLESNWRCIFGHGCQGVLTGPAPELEQGCCSYGAHMTGKKDAKRVAGAAGKLTDEQWQFRSKAKPARNGDGRLRIYKHDPSGALTTRLVDGACIFLNRPGFPGGAGCALHRAAVESGTQPLELKPDVCWQLPWRREDHVEEDGHVVSTIRQWDRRHWGDGGAEFAWWCTESPDAFVGSRPVWEESRAELVALVGKPVYDTVVRLLRARAAARASESVNGKATAVAVAVAVPHPAVRRRR